MHGSPYTLFSHWLDAEMLVCSPCFCGPWWIFYIGLCRKGIRTWNKLEGLDVTHEQGKNQLASFWRNSLWKTVCTCHYKQNIEWPQGCPQYVWTVLTNTSFPWKSTCQWKLKEKVGKSDRNSMCRKRNFHFHLLNKLFLIWAIRASLYLTFHRKAAAKWPDSKDLLPFSLPVPCSSNWNHYPELLHVLWNRCLQLKDLQAEWYKINLFSTYFGIHHQKVLSATSVFIKLRYGRQPYHIESYSSNLYFHISFVGLQQYERLY